MHCREQGFNCAEGANLIAACEAGSATDNDHDGP